LSGKCGGEGGGASSGPTDNGSGALYGASGGSTDSGSGGGPIRLQKLLAQAGVGSRRYCEGLIRDGRVAVDGLVTDALGAKAMPGSRVEVDGIPVRRVFYTDQDASGPSGTPHTYILMNKPSGVISSAKDQFGRKTVVDLVKDKISCRVFPVGRLDYNTTGLILLTDDGDFAYRATHPKFGVEKEYLVTCGCPAGQDEIGLLRNGVLLGDGALTSPARVLRDENDKCKLTLILREGKNRQVRRMMEAVGLTVVALSRTAIGGLTLKGLDTGGWRLLSRQEAHGAFGRVGER